MVRTVISNFDEVPTPELRKLYRASCNDRDVECKWIDKLSRAELVKRIGILVGSGDIKVEESDEKDEPVQSGGIRYPMKPTYEECVQSLLEALRLYIKADIWIQSGRRDDPQTRKYVSDARAAVQRAVGHAIEADGSGWDRANKIAYTVDRAMLRMRNDFNDTLVSNCVTCSLLSDKHAVEMEKALK